jgi:hypothetical protein
MSSRFVRFSGLILDLQVSRNQPKGKASRHGYDLSILEKRGFTSVCPTDVVIVGTITSFFFLFFSLELHTKLDHNFVSATFVFALSD